MEIGVTALLGQKIYSGTCEDLIYDVRAFRGFQRIVQCCFNSFALKWRQGGEISVCK